MDIIRNTNGAFSRLPDWFTLTIVRIAAAVPFWLAGQTRADGLAFWDLAYGQEYEIETFGLPTFLDLETWAIIISAAEHILPLLLVLGFLTRLGALGLLVMTAVIQFYVFGESLQGWQTHILWAGLLIIVLAKGPGPLSLDRALRLERTA